jgi:hypothetical protein
MVLVGVGLFVAAVLTGVDALYWACVAVCVAAAGLLLVARRRLTAAAPAGAAGAGGTSAGPGGADGTRQAASGQGAADAPLGAGQAAPAAAEVAPELPDPEVEDVEVTDLLLVVDLKDEVFVLDEHPRYHLAGCVHLRGRTPIPLPHDEARTDGFTPCAVCEPDHTLADQVRAKKATKGS